MTRYIGLDVHSQMTAVAVLSESGKRLTHRFVPTRAPDLIEVLEQIPKPRRLILEEGAHSEWLSQVLTPFVSDLVVTVPRPARDRTKNDVEDAFSRAEELRRNAIDKRIFKAGAQSTELRAAYKGYSAVTRDVVRTKNRYRSLLLGRGIAGKVTYEPSVEELEALLTKLPEGLRFSAEALLEQILLLENLRERHWDILHAIASAHPDFRLLMSVPGIGEVRAATLLAVVVTPHRFRQSHQFCSYCGLGVLTTASAEWAPDGRGGRRRVKMPSARGLKSGNSALKEVFTGAALKITTIRDEPLEGHYRFLVARGLSEQIARITLARKLAAITLAVWKNKEAYRPERHNVLK